MSIKIMSQVWAESQQDGGNLLVLLAIADFADDWGVSFPSVLTLAKKSRLSESSVHRILRHLQDSGELQIKRQEGPHGCNLYVVNGTGAKIAPGAAGNKKGVPPTAPEPSEEPSGDTSPGEGFILLRKDSPSPAPKGAKRAVGAKNATTQKPFTEEDRQRLTEKYRWQLTDVGFQIDQALNHTASLKAIDLARYVDGWLRRETERKPVRTNPSAASFSRRTSQQPKIDWNKGNSPPMSAERRAEVDKLLEQDREKERQRAANAK